MRWLKNKYDLFFLGFLLSIATCLPFATSLNNTPVTYIAGDGLGYYAYLPATYIYNDASYEFRWFNTIYFRHYPHASFGTNNKEFFVPYKYRTINKYYQGQSFLWLPFFWVAHLVAKSSHYPADGFSYPYQLAIALAALCYLLLGLTFLRKLLQKLFHNELGALIIPIAIFYGTHLFPNTLYCPGLSHVYSFTFVTLLMYYAHSFFNEQHKRWTHFLWAAFCFCAVVFIRPLNGVVVLALPAFMPAGFLKERISVKGFKAVNVIQLLLIGAIVFNQFSILYKQTGTFFPYTYTNERFYFLQPKLGFVLFGYNIGLFVYVPLAFLALIGIFFLKSTKQKILLPLVFFIVVYLYSAWWYWQIAPRTLIDFYAIIAILLGALFKRVEDLKTLKISLVALVFVMTIYFQFKFMQMTHGILDNVYTYSDLFWRNFFRTRDADIYAVPPSSVIKHQQFIENFETGSYPGNTSSEQKYEGKYSAVLNDHTDYTRVFEYKIPEFFKEPGLKKIKFSFMAYVSKDIKKIHIGLNLYGKKDSLLSVVPIYLNQSGFKYEAWDLKEFGFELSDDQVKKGQADHISIYFWNPELKNALYIDEVKTEFFLTDKSYEIIQ